MSDPIDRQAAKDAIVSRAKPYEISEHGNFRHGVYQGLMMARNEVAALDSLPAARDERSLASELLADLDLHWQFDNGQVHTHTWHTKQDFLEKWRKLLSAPAAPSPHEYTTPSPNSVPDDPLAPPRTFFRG